MANSCAANIRAVPEGETLPKKLNCSWKTACPF